MIEFNQIELMQFYPSVSPRKDSKKGRETRLQIWRIEEKNRLKALGFSPTEINEIIETH